MKMKSCLFTSVVLSAGVLLAAGPQVSEVNLLRDDAGAVKVEYRLAGAPAIVTCHFETNGVPVYGPACGRYDGDMGRLIATDGQKVFEVKGASLAAEKLRAVVTAWSPSTPPDFMVVSLATNAEEKVRYYETRADLPGGLLENDDYRSSRMVLRRIPAKGVDWTMGSDDGWKSADGRETKHAVRLDADYYMATFELTQSQWFHIHPVRTGKFNANEGVSPRRPVDDVNFIKYRENINGTADASAYYPAKPGANSFIGKLRDRTGVDFDLPGEAQWEFACRAGEYRDNYWNDGTPHSAAEQPGRHGNNGGATGGTFWPIDCDEDKATCAAGYYPCNAWDLYDMHGNVQEWCLDWYETDITQHGGKVNVDPEHPEKTLSGTVDGRRCRRGGNYIYGKDGLRSAARSAAAPDDNTQFHGCRLVVSISNAAGTTNSFPSAEAAFSLASGVRGESDPAPVDGRSKWLSWITTTLRQFGLVLFVR